MVNKLLNDLIRENRGEITCANSFGSIIWAIVVEFRKFHNNEINLTKRDHSALSSTLNKVIRIFTDDKPEFVSKNVANLIFNINPKIDPFDVVKNSRTKTFGANKVIYEHIIPVKQLISQLMLEVKNVNDVCNFLSTYPGTALITVEEDKCLNQAGGRTQRANWEEFYQGCNIELLSEEDFKQYMKELTQNQKGVGG